MKLNQLLENFNKDGFIIIKNIIDEELIYDFQFDLKNLIKSSLLKAGIKKNYSESDLFDSAMMEIESIDHEYVASIYDTIFQTPSFMRLISSKKIENIVKKLLNNSLTSLYGFTNRCRIDFPRNNSRTYGWHQEVFYTIPKTSYIQSWAPLVHPSTVENGTIEIAIGSHKENIAKQSWNDIEGRATQIIIEDSVISKYQKSHILISPGDLLLFSGYLAHRSGDNLSKQVRYSLVGMYHDVQDENFYSPKISFDFRKQTPQQYFKEVFG